MIEHQMEEDSESGTEITTESQDTEEPDTDESDNFDQPEIAHAGTRQTRRRQLN
jgi:hypothetical protein